MITPERLRHRSRLMRAVRSFFHSAGYLEVDTPIRLPVLIPEQHIRPFTSEYFFLQTSPELCMKLLLAAGHSQLFQICHCFRKEEQGRLHQTEFTMLEWYHVGWSYRELMEECERFLAGIARDFSGSGGGAGVPLLTWKGKKIALTPPWPRLAVAEAFQTHAAMSVDEALDRDLFDELLVSRVEPKLGWDKPVFLVDYPVALGSLARRKQDDPTLAERFELYIGGIELANGFSELVDPAEQRSRFQEEIERIRKTGPEALAMPENLLTALEHLDETAGIALGLDRLLMMLINCDTVAEVVSLTPGDL